MDGHLNEKEIADILVELIRCPSVNPPGNTSECATKVADRLRREGIAAEIVEAKQGLRNVVARLEGGRGGPTLLRNGHIDVVPPGDNWTQDSFAGRVVEDRIYGRGASDMKSGVAAMMAAMIGWKRGNPGFRGDVIFMAVADEETGSEFGTIHLLKEGVATEADFAIVTEPTSLRVELGNRGLRWVDIAVKGKACHAGRPGLGVNAISHAAKLIGAIDSMEFRARNDFFEIPTPSICVTMVSEGSSRMWFPKDAISPWTGGCFPEKRPMASRKNYLR